jgi:hypothetical protein
MIAYEASAGMRPMADTPEEYGGMPLGNTRRNIRMRNDWAYRQKLIAEEEKRKQEAIAARIEAIKAQKQESIENWKHEVAVRLDDEALTTKAEVTRQSKIVFDALQNTDPFADPDGTVATINSTLAKYPNIDDPTKLAIEARKKMAESHGAGQQKILALEAQTLAQKSGKPIESMITRYDTDGTPIYSKEKAEFIKTQIEIDKQKKEELDKVVGPYEQVIAKSNLEMNIVEDRLQNMGPNTELSDEAIKLNNQKREWEMRRSDAEIKKDLATLPRINSPEELKKLNAGDRYITPNGETATYSGKTLAPPAPPVYATGPLAEPSPPQATAPAVQQPPVTAPTKIAPPPTDQLIKQYESVVNDPSADFLTKAEARTKIADIKQQMESEAASAPRRAEAASRSMAQDISASAGANLQDELNKYYNTLFDSGSFNPATGTPMATKAGIDKETLRQGLQRIESIRTALGEDPKTIRLELEQIYSQATRSMQ